MFGHSCTRKTRKARRPSRGPNGWVELRVRLAAARVEHAAQALMDMGSRGSWVREEPPQGVEGACVIAAYFLAPFDPAPVARELGRRIGCPVELEVKEVEDEDWAGQWRKHFRPVPFAPGVWVAPPRASLPARALGSRVRVIRILPGMAFGTGTHATTRMCARALLGVLRSGPSGKEGGAARWDLLDVGTGSGILAIVARRAGGARRVLAIDRDPVAVREARKNARRNRAGGIALAACEPEALRGVSRVVVANLTGPVLVDLANRLGELVAPGGRLVISGFLGGERDEVEKAMMRAGLAVVRRIDEKEWGCSVLGFPVDESGCGGAKGSGR